MAGNPVVIKGIGYGLLVQLGEGEWAERMGALAERLGATPAFFRTGRVALDVGARDLGRLELAAVRALLAQYEVKLWAVVSSNLATEQAARESGLVIGLGMPQTREAAPTPDRTEEQLGEDLILRRTLRSGQTIRHPGHIAVIGDVNAGAEVVAGGDIVVWGRARGTLHAGAMGNERALICALELAPTQLRIAGHIAIAPEGSRRRPEPEVALLEEGGIMAVPWRSRELGRAG